MLIANIQNVRHTVKSELTIFNQTERPRFILTDIGDGIFLLVTRLRLQHLIFNIRQQYQLR